MLSLADAQDRLRAAIVAGTETGIESYLVADGDPVQRLAVHRRHYETSLVKVLVGRFPALEWLLGTPLLREAARSFVHAYPPSAPCLAEYGEGFPGWIAKHARARGMPWLAAVGDLEWHLGIVAQAIPRQPITLNALAAVAVPELPDMRLKLQPGVAYLRTAWPADELIQLFLSGSAPRKYVIEPVDLFLELRGARGVFSITRLGAGEFALRERIRAGSAIGEAIERASEDSGFEPRAALAALFAEELVTDAISPNERGFSTP